MSTKCDNLVCCPVCGHAPIETFWDGVKLEAKYKCHCCGWNNFEITKNNQKEPEKENPYTEFAKEMSLLHEALKAEGFKDAMVDILAAMTPEVWKKVQYEEQKDFLHKTLGINVDDFIAKCNADNKKPRPENWGGGAMT